MDSVYSAECTSSSSLSATRKPCKPLKGCLKSSSASSSPLGSPALGYSRTDTFASFAQACADLQTSMSHSKFNSRMAIPSELNLAIPGPPSDSGSSSPSTESSVSSGACTPVTDGSLTPQSFARKNVSFCPEEDGLEEVFYADIWDRTPAEPAGHLSYQDILELKAIQRTLPRAQQLPDMFTGKPAHHYLQHVPIGLLPLADQSSPSTSPFATPHPTPISTPNGSPNEQGSPNGSAEHSPPRSPICGSPGRSPNAHNTWHSYTPSTTSPLAASALAAKFASKQADKPSFPHNPIPSNLGPKFVPPTTLHLTVSLDNPPKDESSRPLPSSSSKCSSSPPVESPSTPRFTAITVNSPPPSSPATPSIPNPFTLAHLLPSKSTTPMRRKPNFAFLPLLDTPPSSGDITPTANTPVASDPDPVVENDKILVSDSTSPLLGSPAHLIGSLSPSDDEPLSEVCYSSSSSSYTSDSERDSGSCYTDGSALSRTTSGTSVSTAASTPVDFKESPVIGSAYTDSDNVGPGFFLMPPSKHASQPIKDISSFLAAKDPRLQAVASPTLAPPSPLSLDGVRTPETDLVKAMQERLARVEFERSGAWVADLLEDAEPITRSSSSSSRTSSAPVSGSTSREHSRERTDRMDWEEIEKFRRERLGPKWTPPSSRGASRAPSRERNVVEINGVEVDLDAE